MYVEAESRGVYVRVFILASSLLVQALARLRHEPALLHAHRVDRVQVVRHVRRCPRHAGRRTRLVAGNVTRCGAHRAGYKRRRGSLAILLGLFGLKLVHGREGEGDGFALMCRTVGRAVGRGGMFRGESDARDGEGGRRWRDERGL